MGWQGLQQGKKKAKRRIRFWTFYDPTGEHKDEEDKWRRDSLVRLRNTTKLCSAACHGCGHLRDLDGPTIQERRALQDDGL